MRKTERGPLTDRELLESVMEQLDRLDVLSSDHILLIEGKKDRRALEALGIQGDMFQVQSEGGPVNAAEYVEAHGGKAVVLTDWDRRGDSLADQLATLLGRDNPDIVQDVRSELKSLCRTFIKDMESLDSFVSTLSAKVYEQ